MIKKNSYDPKLRRDFIFKPTYNLQHLGEAVYEVVGFGLSETERWKKTKDVGARATCEAVLLVDETVTHVLVRNVEFHTNHQTTSTNIHHVRKMSFLEALDEVVAHFGCVLHKVLAFHHVEYGKSCCTSEVVASEGGTQLSIDRLELWRDEHGSHWETVGNAFGYGDDVGFHIEILMCEEFSTSAIATLDFVADKDSVVIVADSAESLKEFRADHADATDTLNALDDAGTHIALLNLCRPSSEVVEGKVSDVPIGIDRRNDFRISRCFHSEAGAAVESLFEGQDASAAIVERCQFHGVLVGFSSRVDEEELIVLITAGFAESFGKLLLQRVLHGVGIEAEFVGLLCESLHIVRMAMTDGDDCVASVKVEVFLAFIVPHFASLAVVDGYVE